ncbi:DUF4136 domain-containing protein [Microbulbifer elongatus]|uniref:DUF4136 domain-containing protein n=1 Tax=Microbulbifer elongatus TaxID=86173 RepID=UPI001E33122E|nr:DUF4136 domain-containing protein [Microbulbifer elongatus]
MKYWKTLQRSFRTLLSSTALRSLFLTGSLAVSLTLTGCASPPAHNNAAATLAQYRTFGLAPVSGGNGRAMSLAQNEVSRQLISRGMVPSSNPDLLVTVQVRAYPTRQMPVGAPYASVRQSSTEGILTIDLVDARQKQLVWQGRTVDPITREVLNNPQRAMDKAVDEAFRSLPSR